MAVVGLVRHLRNYASAGVLSAVVGLISFPILTRSLSVADYGIVGLISSSITLFIAVGKLGFQHSVIRFYAQIKNRNIDYSMHQMNSTISLVFFVFACFTTVLWLLSGLFVLPSLLQYENISQLFTLASIIIFIRLLGSGILNMLRAQQRSGVVAVATSLARTLNLILILTLLFLYDLNPWTVVCCLVISECSAVVYAAYQYSPEFRFHLKEVSAPLARVMLIYGLPLMMLESLGLVLRLSDRYLIEAMLGVKELGQYSASYNLTAYLDIIVLMALMQAVKPAYMQMWEAEGRERTQRFLSDGLRLYLVIGIPFIAMFAITSPHLLSFLAGEKYSPGTVIIPFVALSFLLEGCLPFLAAGLYIQKNTSVLMLWSVVATLINLGLNIVLIPRFGITGAAVVTVLSYAVFMLGVSSASFKRVSFPIALRVPLFMIVASCGVYMVLRPADLGSDLINFLVKGFSGTSVLLLFIWLIDPIAKQWLRDRFSARRGGAAT